MSDLTPVFPGQQAPALEVPLARGGFFDLAQEAPRHFTMVVFYRGLHCIACKAQLRDLEAKLPEFEKRGIGVVAVSSDNRERAERTKSDWGLPTLRLGHSLDLRMARSWGLYVSKGRTGPTATGVDEPALYSEPGLYLVRPDGTVYVGSVQTMPFARPHFADILSAVDFMIAKNYPVRGDVLDLPQAQT